MKPRVAVVLSASPHLAPLTGVIALLGLTLNTKIQFAIPIQTFLTLPGGLLAGAAYYAVFRPDEKRLLELLLYPALLMLLTVAGMRASYFALSLGAPFQDVILMRLDAAMGFHWVTWAKYAMDHKWLYEAQKAIYISAYWQPMVIVVILAFYRPGENARLILAMLIGLAITLLVFALVPALGPARAYEIPEPLDPVMDIVRLGRTGSVPYTGIICFPSYHAVMAVLFTWANRGLRTFWPFLVLNSLMLLATPVMGDHYIVDLIGGAIVAYAVIHLSPAQRSS